MRVSRCLLVGLALVSLTALWPLVRAQDDEGAGDDEDYGGGDGDGEDYDGEGYGGDDGDGEGGGRGAPAAELKQLTTLAEFDEYLNDDDASVVGFFAEEGSALDDFKATAETMQWDYRFAFTTAEEILAKYKYKSAVVAFKPPRFTSEKVEKTKARYPGASLANSDALKIFLREKTLPLVGKFTYKTKERYTGRGLPVVKVFFDVDYELNPKGSNYYVNRVRKVAEEFADKLSFSIASLQDYSYDTADYGLSVEAGKKQVGVGIDDGRKRFGMVGKDFSVDNLKAFCQSFLAGELTPNKVVEDYTPPPPSPGGDEDEEGGEVDESAVAVAEPSNFDQIVDPAKNVLIEFYAPWCGHCKQLKPVYAKLAKEFADDDDVVIAKMDADAHKVPKPFDVQGFPTIFFKPKGGAPVTYDGARSAEAMAAFVRENKK